jgi:hypothetical protein
LAGAAGRQSRCDQTCWQSLRHSTNDAVPVARHGQTPLRSEEPFFREERRSEIECKGINGTVEFDGSFVTIKRTGALARMTVGKGEKRIPLSQITAVQWKQPSQLIRGFISFTIAGGIENKRGFGKQTVAAAKDENAVVVGHTQVTEFLELRSAIEAAIADHHAPSTRPAPPPEQPSKLKQLKELHDSGLLTDEEYEAKRAVAVASL